MNVTTTKDGTFQFSLKDPSKAKEISVWAPGYFSVKQVTILPYTVAFMDSEIFL